MRHIAKETTKRKAAADSRPSASVPAPEKQPVQTQPESPYDDVHTRIAKRAYELYAKRGYRYGHALEDWLEAEQEIRLERFF